VDVRVRLAGGFTVGRGGRDLAPVEVGSRRGRQLLALLAVARPALITVDALAEVLWPDEVRPRAAADVATLVSRLRKVLGRAAVEGDRHGYRLGAGVTVDLDEAATLLDAAADEADAPALRSAAARRALVLAGDTPPLPDVGRWADPARAQWAQIRRDALHMRSTAAAAAGEYPIAVEAARTAVTADPLDEQAARDLMAAFQAGGQTAAALETYEQLRVALRDELGADPSAATQQLHLALLRDEPLGPAQPPPTARTAGSDLVGRADELDRLRRLWSAAVAGQPGIALIVGESGIGKTALNSALADLVTRTGGTVVTARCYDTERSLLLQPFVDVLRNALTALPEPVIAEVAGEHAGALLTVLPDLGPILGDPPRVSGPPELLRRRTFDVEPARPARAALGQPRRPPGRRSFHRRAASLPGPPGGPRRAARQRHGPARPRGVGFGHAAGRGARGAARSLAVLGRGHVGDPTGPPRTLRRVDAAYRRSPAVRRRVVARPADGKRRAPRLVAGSGAGQGATVA
jgi:DNA-binding SARP family transcriptional activator